MKLPAAALVAVCVLFSNVNAQTPVPVPSPPPLPADGSPTASIVFPDGRSLPVRSVGGRFPLVAGIAGQTLSIQCRIPPAIVSKLVMQPLDGGTLSITSPVTPDGLTTIQFQAGSQPGLYRILVILGPYSATLQFWVPAPSGDNPPVLTP